MNFNFRAWDMTTNKMRGCYGFNVMENLAFVCNVANYELKGRVKTVHAVKRQLEDVILEQSTGLFDTNGEEIFEGDIVRLTFISNLPMVKEVKRIPSNGGIFPFCNYNPFEIGKTEIIGNIHENPELLNKDFVDMRMGEEEAE